MQNKKILVTNDDGINSVGLKTLYSYIKGLGDVICIAPTYPSSAISKALTFHKPIRYNKIVFEDNSVGYSTSGAPADNVLVGFHILKQKPDLVVSGINYGDNSSIHSIFTSGTCAAAFEAAFNGVPAVAFSTHVADDAQLIQQRGVDFVPLAKISTQIVKVILEKKWPEGLAFINVNFPVKITEDTKVYVTRPTLYKYDNYMIEKRDPRNLPYLWLWGERKKTFPEGTDTWAVIQHNAISITPIGFNLYENTEKALNLAEIIGSRVNIEGE